MFIKLIVIVTFSHGVFDAFNSMKLIDEMLMEYMLELVLVLVLVLSVYSLYGQMVDETDGRCVS
jgi:hypothetical protein